MSFESKKLKDVPLAFNLIYFDQEQNLGGLRQWKSALAHVPKKIHSFFPNYPDLEDHFLKPYEELISFVRPVDLEDVIRLIQKCNQVYTDSEDMIRKASYYGKTCTAINVEYPL